MMTSHKCVSLPISINTEGRNNVQITYKCTYYKLYDQHFSSVHLTVLKVIKEGKFYEYASEGFS
jgi:hypothetical protein